MFLTATLRGALLGLVLCMGARAVAQPLAAHAGADVSMCSNAQTILGGTPAATGGNGPYSYSWAPTTGLDDPNIAHPVCTVNTTTTYTLTVTDSNSNTATDNVTVTVTPAPTADLVAQSPAVESVFGGLTTFSLCDPALSWQFAIDDQSSGQPGTSYSVNWGDASPVYNPPGAGWSTTHTYAQGLYNLTYTITAANGCVDTQTFQVFLGTNPGGGISTDPNTNICTGGSLPFYLNSVSNNTPGTTYVIDFGDGTTITLTHPPPAVINHLYNVSSCPGGNFTVSFTAQNPCDHTDGQISPIRVSQTPVVDFSISPNDTACVNSTVTFTDASLGAQAPACSSPKHLWSIAPATYTISGGVLGNVNGNPGNPGLWTTGSTALGVQFTVPGTYTITDVCGNVCGFDTLSRTICVEAPPTPSFTLATLPACAGAVLTTDNTSTALNTCSIRYLWSATWQSAPCNGPGAANIAPSASTFEPTIGFPVAGTYAVSLQAINSCNVPPVTQNVVVGAPPTVALYPVGPLCEGDQLFPSIQSTNGCGLPILSTTWATPNGSITSYVGAPHPGLTYPNAANTNVTVTVTNACGPGSYVAPLVINATPLNAMASAVDDTLCPGETLYLLANTIPGANQYQWSGPGFNSTLVEDPSIPNVTGANAGTYTVVPYIGNCDGPPSTVNIVVLPGAVLNINASDANICAGESTTLTANGGTGYSWTANGVPIPGGNPLVVSPATTTTYGITGTGAGCSGSANIVINVSQPTAVVTAPTALYCDQAVPEILSGNPSPGTWSGANLVNLTAGGQVTPIPGSLGIDTLYYTYVDGNNCTTIAQTIVTIQNETAAQAGTDISACEGDPVIALAGAPGGGSWSGTGVVGSSFNPASSGVFNLTYSYGTGSCAVQDGVVATVVDTPNVVVAAFSVCENESVYALPNGVPAGGTWSGTGVSGSGPYLFDPAAGSQTLVYTATVGGCTGSGSILANVVPPPVADAGPDTTLCDQSIAYDLVGNYGNAGTWSGGAPFLTQNPPQFTPVAGQPGSWTLNYVYTQGSCSDTDQVVVTVQNLTVVADAGTDMNLCENGGAFQLNALPANGAWTPTAFLTASGLFDPAIAGAGPHVITYCTGVGTCLSCDTRTVTVDAPPVVNAGPDLGFCVYEPVQDLFESPAGGTWSGSIGLVNTATGTFDPAIAPLGANVLTYTYTDPNTTCTNTDNVTISVNEVPVAAFTSDPIACQYADFPFTDQSTGSISTWQWDFGDQSGTVFTQNPIHAYLDTGSYTVTLIVGTGNCTDTITHDITVWPSPTVDFDVDPVNGCGPLTVNFTNNSTGPGVVYTWDFGYGAGSNAQFPPSLSYPAGVIDDTTYTVTLLGENLCGSFTDQATITVFPDPTAYFGPDFDSGCSPWPVTFSNVSVGHADTFEWLWGDGTSVITNDSLVMHTYTTDSIPVVRTITLIATNSCGTDTATYDILVQPNTITAFFNTDTTQGCAPLTVNFTQYSIGVTNWYWNFDGVNVSTAYSTSFTYDTAGVFTATLFGDNGCSYDTVSVQITVEPSPDVVFSFAPDPVCGDAPVLFTNLTPDVASTVWDFGDQTGSTLSSVEHGYASPGTYLVTLDVESSINDCASSASEQITVNPMPQALFTPIDTVFCAPATVQLVNNSTGNNLASVWSVNGGIISYQNDPQPHTFPNAGGYNVQLIVTDQLTGCADSTTHAYVGNPTPTSSFTLVPVDPCGDPALVQATSTSTADALTQWYLDDLFINGGPQLLYVLNEPGAHTLSLVAELPGSCTDTSSATFTLYSLPTAAFTTDTACTGQSIGLHDQSADFTGEWWYYNGVFVSTDPNSAAMIPVSMGPDTIALSVMGEGGCLDSTSRIVQVYPAPPADFVPEFIGDCQTVALDPQYITPYAEYLWSVNGIPYSQDLSTWYYYDPNTAASILFNLTVTSIEGCSVPYPVLADVPTCVYVPNSFTPDGDGLNEVFYASILPFARFRDLTLFDRWGHVIVVLDQSNPVWDGTENGEPLPIGVYNWRITFMNGQEDQYGHVTLVR